MVTRHKQHILIPCFTYHTYLVIFLQKNIAKLQLIFFLNLPNFTLKLYISQSKFEHKSYIIDNLNLCIFWLIRRVESRYHWLLLNLIYTICCQNGSIGSVGCLGLYRLGNLFRWKVCVRLIFFICFRKRMYNLSFFLTLSLFAGYPQYPC